MGDNLKKGKTLEKRTGIIYKQRKTKTDIPIIDSNTEDPNNRYLKSCMDRKHHGLLIEDTFSKKLKTYLSNSGGS